MPKMSGINFLRAISDSNIDSKVIAMSGGSLGGDENSETSKAMELGVSGVIIKPFDPQEVLDVCEKVINTA